MCIKRKILDEYVTLDVETTGFNPEKDQIIEVAVCKVKDGNIVDEYTAFVNSKQPIHQSINGFTNNKLNNAWTEMDQSQLETLQKKKLTASQQLICKQITEW